MGNMTNETRKFQWTREQMETIPLQQLLLEAFDPHRERVGFPNPIRDDDLIEVITQRIQKLGIELFGACRTMLWHNLPDEVCTVDVVFDYPSVSPAQPLTNPDGNTYLPYLLRVAYCIRTTPREFYGQAILNLLQSTETRLGHSPYVKITTEITLVPQDF